MRYRFTWRVRVVFVLFIIAAAIIIARLYFVQVVHGESYREQAEGQYVAPTDETENRGDIFFRDKTGRLVTAATQYAGWRLAIKPNEIQTTEKAKALYRELNEIVPLDGETFLARAAKEGDPYEEIASRLNDDSAEKIRALKREDIVLSREKWRFYPSGTYGAHVIGFVGFQDNKKVGRYGLERYYEDTLFRSGETLYVNFFAEIFSSVRTLVSDRGAYQREGDIITSIEPTVEKRLEDTFNTIDEKWHPKRAGGIIMDPHTGEIFAMAAAPSFDPNTFNTVDDPSVFVNPLVESVYELGSIMKPLTMAAGIDTGSVTPETTYYDSGCITKSGKQVCNYDGRGRGNVSMQEVLNQSLNTGASFVVDEMGQGQFAKYIRAYGLGEETGIDLPNEVRGILSGLDTGSDIDYASASFGQGIAVTPIEMVRALSSLANGGYLVQPHVVTEVRYGPGLSKKMWNEHEERVLKPETSEEITRMLVNVVDDALIGGTVKLDRYSVAAKTGTAQIASPYGGYYDDRYLHSFFGYFPAHDPRFLIFLFALEPQNVRYASQTLTEPFIELTQFLINYYNISPDR